MDHVKFHLNTETEKLPNSQKGSLTMLLFLIVGVCEIWEFLFAIGTTPSPERTGVFLFLALLICTPLWYVWFYRKKWFPLIVALDAALYGILLFGGRDDLLYLAEAVSQQSAVDPYSVYATVVVVLLFPLLLLLFCLELLLKNHMILYLLTTALFLFQPLFGAEFSNGDVILLLFFQISFWALQWSGGVRPAEGKKGTKRRVIPGSACIKLLSGFLFFCVVAGFALAWRYPQQLFYAGNAMDGTLYRTISRLSGQAAKPVTGGRISNGNFRSAGIAHLDLTLSRKPGETLYLRGFSGGEYLGGDWTAADDEEIFSNIEKALDWEDGNLTSENFLQEMYYSANLDTRPADASGPSALTIRYRNGVCEQKYAPYYSRLVEDASSDGSGYRYSFFEQKEMNIRQEHLPSDNIRREHLSSDKMQVGEHFQELQQTYLKEIQTVYTRVPEEKIPYLSAFAHRYPLKDLSEISAFILGVLHQNTVYTPSPGFTPQNWDPTDFFLFVRRGGYCQHYALAATLLYRMYGIPARYVTGYRVVPSAFTLQGDGSWQAVVTDRETHAWVEIFLEDYGWTPVEVTPAADGSTAAVYPGFDSQVLQRQLARWDWSNASSDTPAPDTFFSWDPGQAFSDFRANLRLNKTSGRRLLLCLFCLLLLATALMGFRRRWHLRRMNSMDCRGVYARLIETFHFGGLLPAYDGSEKEFAELLSAELPQLPPEDVSRMWDIVCRAAYSPKKPSEEEEELVRNIYRQTANAIYEKLGWRRKLLFRYWKGFV